MRTLAALLFTLICTVSLAQESRGTFVVDAVPSGEAPLWVREAWIGVEIPYHFKGFYQTLSILTSQLEPFRPNYCALQSEALEALEKKSVEAARWWREHGFPRYTGDQFCFDYDVPVS